MIYAVMYSYYSDWEIYGYFTSREEADKYCIAHKNEVLYVKEIPCFDNTEDLSHIALKYEYSVFFSFTNNHCSNKEGYTCYQDEFLRSNKLESSDIHSWIRVHVNISEPNEERANKIAQDLYYQYLVLLKLGFLMWLCQYFLL